MKLSLLLCTLLILPFLGCCGTAAALKALPPGTQMQSSTFGVKIAPQAVDGTPLVVGSHSTIVTTAQPDNAPNLNRFEGTAPFTKVKSTVATGAVGEQLKAAGGPEALKHLLDSGKPLDVPTFRPPSRSGIPKPITPPAERRPDAEHGNSTSTPLPKTAALDREFPQPLTSAAPRKFTAFPASKEPAAPDPRRSLQLPPNFSD